jgi:asparagine N-glycosylation enzyme membrane subunit Stt3
VADPGINALQFEFLLLKTVEPWVYGLFAEKIIILIMLAWSGYVSSGYIIISYFT